MSTPAPAPPRTCTVCGRGRIPRLFTRILLGSLVPCLSDQNDQHHAGCMDGCDGCYVLLKLGRRQ